MHLKFTPPVFNGSIAGRKNRLFTRLLSLSLTAISVAGFNQKATAQLSTGSIAFTAFNADEDGWALVTLANIPANTIIYFTDNEATSLTAFNTGESYHQWNTGAAVIPAGTVVRFSAVDHATNLAATAGTFTRLTVSGSANFGLSTGGETVYAYLANAATPSVPVTFLAAVTNDETAQGITDLTNAGLSNGTNAIVLTSPASSPDFGQYTGPRNTQSNFAAYLPLVTDITKWYVDSVDGNYASTVPDAAAFTLAAIANTPIDLSTYVRVGRYDLPEPTRTTAPANNLLAQEVSAVTYNWDTETLFVVGDGGTAVVQVTKTGQLINSMTLAPGSSPQNTEFYDPEGLTYIGNGQFVMAEERDRQMVLFTYVPNTTLTRAAAKTVKTGTFLQNIGNEGLCWDPLTNGYIVVKEIQPKGIFQTGIDFNAGTATNGSPTTDTSVNLFPPDLTGLSDFADVFALSNLPALAGMPEASRLLVSSQEDAKIINTDRAGNISSSLTIVSDPGNPLTAAAQQHEGLTMDRNKFLYVVSENGGGDFDHPQLWVYAPSSVPNQAPTAVTLNNKLDSVLENTSTTSRLKVADIFITDDGIGTNNISISGPDAAFFEIIGFALYIKAGTVLDYETKTSYNITISVDDPTVGTTPDATTTYTLFVKDVLVETPVTTAAIIISEVAPWSSGNSPVNADWFELTNTTSSAIDITGWKVDDNSNSFAAAVALNGITSIAPGESVIFIETATPATTAPLFLSTWFGSNPPAGLKVGSYTGSGIGLSTGGDALNIYNSTGVLQANITFGTSPAGPAFPTFNNAAGLNNTAVTQLSIKGVNGAFAAISDTVEVGSPGTIGKLFISEVAPWGSGNSPVGADWFEVTNTLATDVNITGWKMDDNSGSPAAAVPLAGITTIPAGKSVIFIETATPATTIPLFISNWFGANPPAGLLVGSYTGSGVGLGTSGDAVHLYNAAGLLQASVFFGNSPAGPSYPTFDNAASLNNVTITQLSAAGVNGAFVATNSSAEIGSPGTIVNGNPSLPVTITALKASKTNNGIVLGWTAYNEKDIALYQVERSQNAVSFTSVGTVTAKANNALEIRYDFLDANPAAGTNYYRIKIGGKNGAVSYTNIVRVMAGAGNAAITVYPNPVKGNYFTLELSNANKGIYGVQLMNSAGQLVFNKLVDHPGGSSANLMRLQQQLPPGLYQLKVSGNDRPFTQKIIVQ